ncbi:MAG: O-antigen ligase family protein [Anaerolineae bacterium]|nr:O-antigen ligase family protein [Anaerolineae bacterium]
MPTLLTLRAGLQKSYFHAPLILLGLVILMGIVVSLLRPYPPELQKDSVVNGLRLILAISVYFVVLRLPFPTTTLTKTLFYAVMVVSFITTAVSLLQIVYWEKWLPIQLPAVLTEIKEEANQAQGREIFALFIGDTGTHVWSAMLAFQALVVWVLAISSRNFLYKISWFVYFSVLFLILARTSVRNSLLGLIIAIAAITLIRTWRSPHPLNYLLKPYLLITLAIVLLVGLFSVAPDTYYIERIRQAIPQFESGKLVILRGSNIYGRLDGSRAALEIFSAFPLTGGGFGSYSLLSVSLANVHKLSHAHNSYLQFLAEMGVAGFIAIIGWSGA